MKTKYGRIIEVPKTEELPKPDRKKRRTGANESLVEKGED